ncbi:MAG: hypothetical protein IKH54_01960 [Bacilli bacterium]|nr:hypothetical protein [Bacilli bacterium]
MDDKKNSSFFSTVLCFFLIYMVSNYFFSEKNISNNSDDSLKYSYVSMQEDDIEETISKLEKEFNIVIDEDHKDELLFLNSIYENDNLDDKQKNVLYGIYSILDDIDKIDRESAYRALSNVEVFYTTKGDSVASNVLGDYNYKNNRINIYSEDVEYKTLVHEILHAIFTTNKTLELPDSFSEGMIELLANEYFSNDPFVEELSYPYEVSFAKMLCEVVDPETVIDCLCTGNFNNITNKLDKYNNTNYSSYEILDSFFKASDIVKNGSIVDDDSYSKKFSAIKSIYANAHPYGENLREFNYHFDLCSAVFEEDPFHFYQEYLIYNGALQKGYFSSQLKRDYLDGNFVEFFKRDDVKVKSYIKRNLTN